MRGVATFLKPGDPPVIFTLALLGGDAEPKADLVFLYVKAGMTVIVDDGKDWRIDSGS